MNESRVGNSVQILIAAATLLLGALGLAFWSNKAQNDRSAFVGLYLLFGIPGGLMLVAGLALLVNGNSILGTLLLLVVLGLTLPLIHAVRVGLAEVMPFDPDSAIDMSGLCIVLGALGWFTANSLVPMAANPPDVSEIAPVGVTELIVQAAAFLAL